MQKVTRRAPLLGLLPLALTLAAQPALATLITTQYIGADYDAVSGSYDSSMHIEMSLTFDDTALYDNSLNAAEILSWSVYDGLMGCGSPSGCLLAGSGLWSLDHGGVQFGDDNWTGTEASGDSWMVVDGNPGIYTKVRTELGTADVRFDDSGFWRVVMVVEPGTPALFVAGLLTLAIVRRKERATAAAAASRSRGQVG